MTERFYTVDEAKAQLGIGTTAFYALLKSGDIRRVKIGRRTVIANSNLQKFMAQKLEEATV